MFALRLCEPLIQMPINHLAALILKFAKATEATIDLAIHLHIPFAIVPCCVFPSEFPNRKYNGKIVKSYTDFIEYLLAKHKRIRTDRLDFIEDTAETGKSLVLYMLEEDFE